MLPKFLAAASNIPPRLRKQENHPNQHLLGFSAALAPKFPPGQVAASTWATPKCIDCPQTFLAFVHFGFCIPGLLWGLSWLGLDWLAHLCILGFVFQVYCGTVLAGPGLAGAWAGWA